MIPKRDLNPRFFVLQAGDIIQRDDQYYNPISDEWLPVEPEFIGDGFSDDESKPVRRENVLFISSLTVTEGQRHDEQ